MDIERARLHMPRVIARKIADQAALFSDRAICEHIDSLVRNGQFADALIWSFELEARIELGALGESWAAEAMFRRTQTYREHVADRILRLTRPRAESGEGARCA